MSNETVSREEFDAVVERVNQYIKTLDDMENQVEELKSRIENLKRLARFTNSSGSSWPQWAYTSKEEGNEHQGIR